jgi:cytochrome P450
MSPDFPHASVVEGIRFTAQIGVPNVILGLFNKRELPSRIAAGARSDYLGYRLVEGMVRSYGPGPIYVRVAAEEALLVHHPADLEFVLGGSPDPFSSDPEPKRKGMAAFQPDALTISRGRLWEERRRFAEAVLDTDQPLHRLAQPFVDVATQTAEDFSPAAITWSDWNSAFQRLTRRVIFGDKAADDTRLTTQLAELMSAGNKMPGSPAPGYPEFISHITTYLKSPEPNSLAALVAEAGCPADTDPAGQVVHWMFAMGDTLAANAFRTLAVLASHSEHRREVAAEAAKADIATAEGVASLKYLAGCLLDTMRLWPTTTLFGRVAARDVEFPSGAVLPAGKQVLIYNVFNHRNRDRIPYADRFSPGEWVSGNAGSDWSYNFFSHGPQGCPGATLSVLLGRAVLAHLLHDVTPVLRGVTLDPTKSLPHSVDLYAITIER